MTPSRPTNIMRRLGALTGATALTVGCASTGQFQVGPCGNTDWQRSSGEIKTTSTFIVPIPFFTGQQVTASKPIVFIRKVDKAAVDQFNTCSSLIDKVSQPLCQSQAAGVPQAFCTANGTPYGIDPETPIGTYQQRGLNGATEYFFTMQVNPGGRGKYLDTLNGPRPITDFPGLR